MRYFCHTKGQSESIAVEIEPTADGYNVLLNGKWHRVNAASVGEGRWSLLLEGASHDVTVEERGDELLVSARGRALAVQIWDELRMRRSLSAPLSTIQGRQKISAPMPGKVVKVLVQLGQSVEPGQGLVVIEAMKMENELKSPKAGKVVELSTSEGASVENGAGLVVVE